MTGNLFQSIVHPTDFSEAGLDALAHALRIAIAAGGVLHVLHIERDHDAEKELTSWSEIAHAEEMMARWRSFKPADEQYPKGFTPGVKVVNAAIEAGHPAQGVGFYVSRHPCDLLVLMTHSRYGLEAWLHESAAESIARRVHAPTLFLREGQKGFVNRVTGDLFLRTILFPIDGSLPHREAGSRVAEFARVLAPHGLVHTLHVGSAPPENAKELSGAIDLREGPVVETIFAVAREIGADVIAMPTAGRHGIFDELRGSDTERVLREAPCPVLAIPV
jgi:nucleotide-binding universal stress UspA family protein